MNVRPAGREACNCASPYNSILERLDAMEAEILAVQATANSAMGVANAQAGAAASSASAAAASATAAGNAAISAAADASDALTQATASAGSADDAADSAADALTALQTIEGTIASVLASDIGGKVDKLTTAGFYLYMHNGSTQGEVQPVVAPTAATIPIRDSDGRMQAADPASGATDKTLVTANWVSQSGDDAPNNLMHRNGDETITDTKIFTGTLVDRVAYVKNTTGSTQPIPAFKLSTSMKANKFGIMDVYIGFRRAAPSISRITWNDTTLTVSTNIGTLNNAASIWKDTNDDYYLCFSMPANDSLTGFMLTCIRNAGFISKAMPMNRTTTPSLTGWQQVAAA